MSAAGELAPAAKAERPGLSSLPAGALTLPRPGAARVAVSAILVLWRRDLLRFFRQRSRVLGALVQPFIFWLVIGSGLSGSFRLAGAPGLDYLEYFFPGVILMVVLFTSIFTTLSVVEDRHAGFLQAVLVAPCPRAALVAGKTLGGATIALVQAALFLALAPLAGYPLGGVDWPALVLVLALIATGLTAAGFAIAWWIDSVQGYHAIMSVLLIPLWIVSGAMFPAEGAGTALGLVMRANPLAYAADGLRRALYGGELPPGLGVGASAAVELLAVAALSAAGFLCAVWACNRRA